MKRAVLALALSQACLSPSPAPAHDFWANGEPVPPWVKSWCCGPSDVHMLNPGAVHVLADGYRIDGLKYTVPFTRALPSADGHYWAFFKESDGPNAYIYCFYAPVNGA